MRVLIVSADEDTGGAGATLAQAVNRHTDWEAREVHRQQNYIGYPVDILWPHGEPRPAMLEELFDAADVVHVMERWDAVDHYPEWRRKPLVIHHHGTFFRDNLMGMIRSAAEVGAYPVCSTVDLTILAPGTEWLPNPCDIGRMRRIRAEEFQPHEGLIAAHSPTWRHLKGTDAFVGAAQSVGYEVDVIERVDWESCLRRKARADVFYDQLTDGYGLSGIESMAMGIATIAGARNPQITDLMLQMFGNHPFLLATPESLRGMLEYLRDPDVRAASAAVSVAFVEKYHDEAVVARQLVGIYEKAMEMR